MFDQDWDPKQKTDASDRCTHPSIAQSGYSELSGCEVALLHGRQRAFCQVNLAASGGDLRNHYFIFASFDLQLQLSLDLLNSPSKLREFSINNERGVVYNNFHCLTVCTSSLEFFVWVKTFMFLLHSSHERVHLLLWGRIVVTKTTWLHGLLTAQQSSPPQSRPPSNYPVVRCFILACWLPPFPIICECVRLCHPDNIQSSESLSSGWRLSHHPG